MTSNAAIKSASFALKAFLEGKPTGYEFTVDSLREDFMTDPATSATISRGACSGFVSKAYARKALTRCRLVGHIRQYKLVDAALIFAQNKRSRGSTAGARRTHKEMPDTEQAPILPGLAAARGPSLMGIPRLVPDAPPWVTASPKLKVSPEIAGLLTRDTMLGSIREIIDAHLAAFEANRLPASIDEMMDAVGAPEKVAMRLSTDVLLAEIKRRTDHG